MLFKNKGWMGAARRRRQARVPWWLLLTSVIVAGLVWLLYREDKSAPPPRAPEEPADEWARPAEATPGAAMPDVRDAFATGEVRPDLVDPGRQAVVEAMADASEVDAPAPQADHWAGLGEVEPWPQSDDLTRIEGVGPKIAEVLRERGIRTFAALASRDVERLRQILREAGLPALANPETWPEQARLLAEGDVAGLQRLQDEIKTGRQQNRQDLQD